jgi:hypothetical protein
MVHNLLFLEGAVPGGRERGQNGNARLAALKKVKMTGFIRSRPIFEALTTFLREHRD